MYTLKIHSGINEEQQQKVHKIKENIFKLCCKIKKDFKPFASL